MTEPLAGAPGPFAADREERRFRLLAEAIPQIVWTAAEGGRCDYVNGRWCDYTGLSPGESTGRGWLRAVHPDDLTTLSERWRAAFRDGSGFEREYRLRGRDGAYRWFLGRAEPLRDDEGRPLRWFGTATDVDDRRRAEAEALPDGPGIYAAAGDASEADVRLAGVARDVVGRSRVGDAPREGELRLRMALEAGELGTWEIDSRRAVLTLDDRAGAILGLASTGPLALRGALERWVVPDDRGRVVEAIRWALDRDGDGRYDLEHRVVRPDGTVAWLAVTGRAAFEGSGPARAATRLIGTVRDVTDRKRREEALSDREEWFRLAAGAMCGLVYDWDMAAGGVRRSGDLHALIGYRHEEVPGDPAWWHDRIHPEDARAADEAFARAVAARSPSVSTEYRIRHRDGRDVWVWDHSHIRYDAGGRPSRLFGCTVSIEQRTQAEARLRASEARYRGIFENAAVGIAEAAPDGRFTEVNDRLCRMLGYTKEELLGKSVWEISHPDDLPGELALAGRVVDRTIPAYTLAKRYLRKDGTVLWANLATSALVDESGRVIRAIGVVEDVTERRLAEEALRAADRRKNEFLAILSHELRNPLSAVRGALPLAGPDAPADDRSLAVGVIDRQSRHLARLVDDLLDLARIHQGKIELARERVAVADAVARSVEAVRPQVEAQRHRLEVDVAPGPLGVDADPTRLDQILTNLLANAARYTPPGGRIEVSARREGGDAVVSVRDDGMGIPAEMLERIFEMYAQGDEAARRSQGGLGIGLSLVRRLVELHGGSIAARSDGPGRGSTFTLRLPLAADPEAGPPRSRPARAAPPGVPRRILLVDDNADSVRVLERTLRRLGHEVATAPDGPEALDRAGALRPEVVLLDIGLPGMDGYEVAGRLRAAEASRPALLVALSGYGREQDRERSRAAGFDHHMTKPVDLDVLLALLAGMGRGGGTA